MHFILTVISFVNEKVLKKISVYFQKMLLISVLTSKNWKKKMIVHTSKQCKI